MRVDLLPVRLGQQSALENGDKTKASVSEREVVAKALRLVSGNENRRMNNVRARLNPSEG